MKRSLPVLFFALFLACGTARRVPVGEGGIPSAPDYAQEKYWAALPWIQDLADETPEGLQDRQQTAPADVFFLHPTSYFPGKVNGSWIAYLEDEKLNKKTDEGSIKYQASIFNAAGRVFAPRYRQAHLQSFFTRRHKEEARNALEVAYSDVRSAFLYYLEHYNDGRPILIAAHSQGAFHARELINEFVDGQPLQDRLVVAYLVGWPVVSDAFRNIPVCERPEQIGCFCSWRTVRQGYFPPKAPVGDSIAVVNPLNWTTAEGHVPANQNKGGVLRDFNEILPNIVDGEIRDGFLFCKKPKFPWSFLFTRRNYHIGDLNLYYMNVRENAVNRVEAFSGN